MLGANRRDLTPRALAARDRGGIGFEAVQDSRQPGATNPKKARTRLRDLLPHLAWPSPCSSLTRVPRAIDIFKLALAATPLGVSREHRIRPV